MDVPYPDRADDTSDVPLNTVTQADSWLGDDADQKTAEFAHHPKSTCKQKPVQKGRRKRKLGDGRSLLPPSMTAIMKI